MKLSDDAINEYIELHRQFEGMPLSMADAREEATRLVTLMEVLCSVLPSGQSAESVANRDRISG